MQCSQLYSYIGILVLLFLSIVIQKIRTEPHPRKGYNAVADINFWLALAFEVHAHHSAAVAWFDNAGPDSCAFCRLTQQGFLRLVTNQVVFKDEAVTMRKDWSCYDSLLEDERVFFMREPEGLEQAWRAIMMSRKYSHEVWNDAYLAAFAQTANLDVVTFDRGFKDYKSVQAILVS